MGDRHNIGILQYKHGAERPHEVIWLYAHHGFWSTQADVDGFAATLAWALDEARPRWDDFSYFNRILILALGDGLRGISLGEATSDEHKRFVVDPRKESVYLMPSWSGRVHDAPAPILSLSYEAFIKKFSKHTQTYRNEY